MSSAATETVTHDNGTIRPARAEQSHVARMAALYAWIGVTLAIFVLAGMLAGMEDAQATVEGVSDEVRVVGTVDRPTP